jgi:hypothetical protein
MYAHWQAPSPRLGIVVSHYTSSESRRSTITGQFFGLGYNHFPWGGSEASHEASGPTLSNPMQDICETLVVAGAGVFRLREGRDVAPNHWPYI